MPPGELRLGAVTDVPSAGVAIFDIQTYLNQMGVMGYTLTLGAYLTGGSYNGTADVTAAVNATSANIASAVVARDASGNFAAGTITAALTGNATTATTLQTARTINGVSFDGSANITVTAAAGTLTGTTLASNVVTSSLTTVGTLGTLTVTGAINSQTISSAASFTGTVAAATAFYSTILDSNAASDLLLKRNNVTEITLGSSGITFNSAIVGTTNIITTSTQPLMFSGAGTGPQSLTFANTGAGGLLGIEGSAGGAWFVSAPAYATVLGTSNATALVLGTNGSANLIILSGGAATFSSTLGTTTLTASTSVLTTLLDSNAAIDLVLQRNGVPQLTLGSSVATFAGQVITGASVIIPNNTSYYQCKNSGASGRAVLYMDSADTIHVGDALDASGGITHIHGTPIQLGRTGSADQTIVGGTGYGAGGASLRLNGLTSGAAAAAGTLLNAPTAGNPVFWIPINIAGTVRYVPAW